MQGMLRKSVMLLLVLAVFAGHVVSGEDEDLTAELKNLQGGLGKTMEGMEVPLGKIIDKLKVKCEQEAGSSAAFEEAKAGSERVHECLTPLLNWEQLLKEVEEAKPTGDLEIVFNKYCRRRYTAMDCVRNFTASATPCLSKAEQEHKTMFEKMLEKLLSFVCHKDGDQIALFIAEKGPECFASKKDEMWRCVNETYGEKLAMFNGMSPENVDPEKLEELARKQLPQLTIEKSDCENFETVEYCISDVLEQCEETTPANLFQSAAKFVRNESPCKNFTSKNGQRKQGNAGGAASLVALPWLLLVAAAAVVGVKVAL